MVDYTVATSFQDIFIGAVPGDQYSPEMDGIQSVEDVNINPERSYESMYATPESKKDLLNDISDDFVEKVNGILNAENPNTYLENLMTEELTESEFNYIEDFLKTNETAIDKKLASYEVSAQTFYMDGDGFLDIRGTSEDDQIIVTAIESGGLEVNINGTATTYKNAVGVYAIDTGAGDDTITIQKGVSVKRLITGDGDDTITNNDGWIVRADTGDGDDTIINKGDTAAIIDHLNTGAGATTLKNTGNLAWIGNLTIDSEGWINGLETIMSQIADGTLPGIGTINGIDPNKMRSPNEEEKEELKNEGKEIFGEGGEAAADSSEGQGKPRLVSETREVNGKTVAVMGLDTNGDGKMDVVISMMDMDIPKMELDTKDETPNFQDETSLLAFNGSTNVDVRTFLETESPEVVDLLGKIALEGLSDSEKILSIFNFLSKLDDDELSYQSDSALTGWKSPTQTIQDKGGDCEDLTNLFVSLCDAAGLGDKIQTYVDLEKIGMAEVNQGHVRAGFELNNGNIIELDIAEAIQNNQVIDNLNTLPLLNKNKYDFSFNATNITKYKELPQDLGVLEATNSSYFTNDETTADIPTDPTEPDTQAEVPPLTAEEKQAAIDKYQQLLNQKGKRNKIVEYEAASYFMFQPGTKISDLSSNIPGNKLITGTTNQEKIAIWESLSKKEQEELISFMFKSGPSEANKAVNNLLHDKFPEVYIDGKKQPGSYQDRINGAINNNLMNDEFKFWMKKMKEKDEKERQEREQAAQSNGLY